MPSQKIQILLVEDNQADADLVREIIEEKLLGALTVVHDGEEALSHLRKQDRHQNCSTPDLILLDLNLPRKDGRSVLREVKSDTDLKRIPIVVLTTSEADRDILESYDLNANCYIKKPNDFDQFVTVLQYLNEFWVNIVKLPPKIAAGEA